MRRVVKVELGPDLAHANELKRVPLDAEVACPECGDTSWDRVDWRADPDAPTARVRGVVCRSCGRIEAVRSIGRLRRPDPPDVDDPCPLADDPSAGEVIEAAGFPVYLPAAPRLPRVEVGARGWGSESGRLEGIILDAHDSERSVKVGSYTDRLPLTATDRARKHLARELRSALPDVFDRDPDVAALKRDTAYRQLWTAVESAPAVRIEVPVEGDPVEFVLVEHGGRWAANATGIIVVGRNVTPAEVALRLLRPDDELAR